VVPLNFFSSNARFLTVVAYCGEKKKELWIEGERGREGEGEGEGERKREREREREREN